MKKEISFEFSKTNFNNLVLRFTNTSNRLFKKIFSNSSFHCSKKLRLQLP